MKKFTLLFASLFIALGAMAQTAVTDLSELSNDKKYFLESARCFLSYKPAASDSKLCTSNASGEAVERKMAVEAHQFNIVSENDQYYLYSIGADKYVSKDGSFVETKSDALTLDNVGGDYPWKLCIGGNGLNSQIPGQMTEGIVVNSWTSADAGNCYQIIDVPADYVDPVYVSDLKDFNPNKAYTLTTKQRGAWTVNNELTELSTTSSAGQAVDATDTKQHFAVLTLDNENYYLFNVAANKFVKSKYTLVASKGTPIKLNDATSEGANRMQIQYVGDDNGYFNIGGSSQRDICGWSAIDHGNAVLFTEIADFDPTEALAMLANETVEIEITYNFTYNGQPLEGYTQTVKTVAGAEYPNVTVAFPFGVSATKPEGTIAVEDAPSKTMTIPVEENLPFKYAADANSIKNWYYIQQHSSAGYGKYLQYAETYIEWLDATIAVDEVDTYTWAFVGDPFAGFKMVNYGAPENANAVVTNGSDNPSFGALTDATAWNIKASATNNDAEHFCFQYPGSSQYMNAQGGKIAFWGSADQGSTMWVTERDMTGTAELQALIDQIDAVVAAYGDGGTTVGYYTAESAANLVTVLNAAKEAVADEDRTLESNVAAMVALQNAVAALVTIQPTEGAFYYISSAMPSSDGRSGQKMYVNNDGAMQFQNAATLANVFQFVSAGDNTFYLYNVERGTYLNTAKGHAGGQATAVATTGTVKVAIANMGRANVVSIIPNGGAMLHAQAAGSQVVAWNNTDNAGASAWIISEVADITELSHTLTVGDAGYATLCLGYNATIPALAGEECGVYTAAVVDGYAAMTKVEDVLPANTAVIVKAAAGTYNFNYATGEVSAIENNELKGTTINKNFTDAAYVLGVVEGEVGLYTAANNVSTDTSNDDPEVTYEAWKNNAFKAYLPKTAGMNAASYSFRFGGDTTGVENVVVENEIKAIYDLTGRRVEAITAPGIYVVNGKKVLVK